MKKDRAKSNESGNFSIYNISIKNRLPILITALLIIVIVIFTVTSYNDLRKISFEGGKERLNSLVTEFSSLFRQSTAVFLNSTDSAANSSAVKDYVKSKGKTGEEEALKELDRISSKTDSLTLMVELRNESKRRILTSSYIKKDIQPDPDFLNKYLLPNKITISRFYTIGNHIYWAATVPIVRQEKTIGYITRWRMVLASKNVVQQMSKLLGSNASLYIGNKDGKLWYNLINIVSNPPVEINEGKGSVEYTRDKNIPVIAQVKQIPGTEWLVLIELSKDRILHASNQFLGNVILIGIVLIIGGFLLAMMMSHSITKPLGLLTRASSNIALGDYSSFVTIKQGDELGKLANSFNFMLSKINESQNHLQSSLKEKEILLKEIHHRVKNNLQIISSLLNLQTSFLKEEESIQAIESSRNRIRSMAIVHEKLYQTESFIQINFKDYVEELIKNLSESYKSAKNIVYKAEIEKVFINIDLATSLGLIITELISNAVKHAFKDISKNNEIVISGSMLKENCYKLIFKDNGQGLPKDYDISTSESLGLQLVTSLVDQINGTMKLQNTIGTQFEITFYLNQKLVTAREIKPSLQV